MSDGSKGCRTAGRWAVAAVTGIALAAGGCDLVAGIGTFCEVGVDPGCGAGGAGGGGGSGGGVCTAGEAVSCYGGPAGTEGVGVCAAGKSTCGEDGKLGACEGEVGPGKETCAGVEDEDCDKKECAYWSAAYGSAAGQATSAIAVNDQGEVFLSAVTKEEAVPFGDFSVGGENLYDAFVVKFDPQGKPLWGRFIEPAQGVMMTANPQGGVFVAGTLNGSVTFGRTTLTPKATIDTYVAKLDKDGNFVWAKQFCETGICEPKALVADEFGDVILVGTFDQSIDFDELGAPPHQTSGGSDAYIVKLAGSKGAKGWSRTFGDPMSKEELQDVAVNMDGDIVVTGLFEVSATFGGSTYTNATPASRDVFVSKLDASGQPLWGKALPVESSAEVRPAVLADKSILLYGRFSGAIHWDGMDLASAGGNDLVLARMSATGTLSWARQFGGGSSDSPAGISPDASGGFVLGAVTDGGIDFGGGVMLSAGSTDFFVARFDAEAEHLWSRRFGDSALQGYCSLATSWPSGDIALMMTSSTSVDFGAGPVNTFGLGDLVVAKLAP